MSLYDHIPNNVNLSEDKRLQRALEKWLPNFLGWWHDMGPDGFQDKDVWLRTAVDVGSEGWAHFDYVKMPDYRWGIFLEPAQRDAKVGFGDNYGAPAIQEVPGEFRNSLRASSSHRAILSRLQSSNKDFSATPVRPSMTCAIFFK